MHIMFGLQGEVPSAITIDGKSKIKPLESYSVKLLSIGFFSESNQAVVWRGPMASKALNQLIWDAHWGELDYLLVDLPPGTGDIHLSLVQSIPITGAVVVTTPQNISLEDAKKGISMFKMDSINVPVLGLVENMSYFTPAELPQNKYYIFGKNGGKELAENMNIELLAQIPLVQSVREAADAGRPALLQGSTPIAIEFLSMTKEIVAAVNKRNVKLAPTKAVELTNKKKVVQNKYMITDKNIISRIENALSEIRPFLESDGGDIRFLELTDDWVVKVKLIGACSSCNISSMTMKNGVEVAVKTAVPEVKEVVEVSSL